MNMAIVRVITGPDEGNLVATQQFIDDPAGAVREIIYWEAQGKRVELVQFTETSDRPQ